MIHGIKVCFSKNPCVVKVIVDGKNIKLPTQSTSEVPELDESNLVKLREKVIKV